MKNWIIAIIIIITVGIAFFIAVLITNTEKDEQDLGDSYYYLPSYEAIDVGLSEGAIIYKSFQKNVFSDIKIHGDVIDMNYNDNYIIAIQQSQIDSVHIKHKKLYYFIINKKSDIVFGPFNKIEYLKKKEELDMPNNLNFNN